MKNWKTAVLCVTFGGVVGGGLGLRSNADKILSNTTENNITKVEIQKAQDQKENGTTLVIYGALALCATSASIAVGHSRNKRNP